MTVVRELSRTLWGECMEACYLCKAPARLQRSHFVPSFVGKWLKDNSVTGFIRHGNNQNLRQQGLPKQPLRCSSCEGRFSSLRTGLLVISSTLMCNRYWTIGGHEREYSAQYPTTNGY